MTFEDNLRLEHCWNCLVILFTLFCAGNSYCVKEGDCVVLRCPSGGPINPSRDPGPIYKINWTHIEDTYTTVQKSWVDKPTFIRGKFRERVQVLENGDLKIFNVEESLSGTYFCDVFYALAIDSRTTRNKEPIQLVVFAESAPPNCEPVNDCAEDGEGGSGGLDEKITNGLIVAAGILGVIFVIFASLCIWAQWNKRRRNRMPNQQKSIIYNTPNLALTSSPQSGLSPPISSVPAEYQNTGVSHYDEIPYDAIHNIKAKHQDNDYSDLPEMGVDRQDSGIELDNNSNASENEPKNKEKDYSHI